MTQPPTAASRLLQEAARLGVDCIFTNLGSDHPAFIEAFASITAAGAAMPRVIACPHEMTALGAAHGHAMRSRRAQLVLVHVDVGTQNLGASIHNAARGRVPAVVIAGLSPVTISGRAGSRTEYIHYTQDMPRQQEIVGPYVKWSYEVRAGEMVDQVLLRGLQVAASSPQGPVYLTGAREVWEEPAAAAPQPAAHWQPPAPAAMPTADLEVLHEALLASRRPLVVTSYAGRDPLAAERLAELSDRIGLAVCEVNPQYMNFPGDHPHHVGYRRNSLVAEADLLLMLDVDVPWMPNAVSPAPDARLFQLDCDTLKADLGFWHFPAERRWQADSRTALEQLLALRAPANTPGRAERVAWIEAGRKRATLPDLPAAADGGINLQQASDAVARLVTDRTVLLFEAPTATERMLHTLRMRRPGSYLANGGSGLGWSINAAVGVKLADPDAEVITVVGDGSYVFGVPSSTYWVAATYEAPQLTVILNNGGWHAPKVSTLLVHPKGTAQATDSFWSATSARARLADIAAAAAGAAAFRVEEAKSLDAVLQEALHVVRGGRSAAVEIMLPPMSRQVLGPG